MLTEALNGIQLQRVADRQELVVEAVVCSLSSFTSEELIEVADYAESISAGYGNSWLPAMIREYVEAWRQ